ncbi:unnamed protein product, partial [Pelagomonas calceolata]
GANYQGGGGACSASKSKAGTGSARRRWRATATARSSGEKEGDERQEADGAGRGGVDDGRRRGVRAVRGQPLGRQAAPRIRCAVGLGYERDAVVAGGVFSGRLDGVAEQKVGRAAARGPRQVRRAATTGERVAVHEGAAGAVRGRVRDAVLVVVAEAFGGRRRRQLRGRRRSRRRQKVRTLKGHPDGRLGAPGGAPRVRGAVGLGHERDAVPLGGVFVAVGPDGVAVEEAGRAAARGPRQVRRAATLTERVAVLESAAGIGRGGVRHAVAVEVRGPGCPEAQQKGNGLHLGYVQQK